MNALLLRIFIALSWIANQAAKWVTYANGTQSADGREGRGNEAKPGRAGDAPSS
jgi:hypothetical protein